MNFLRVTSPAFLSGEKIPEKYTFDGANINPEIDVFEIPEYSKSLALIVEDPDAQNGTWVHWILFNIKINSVDRSFIIKENSIPGIEGMNDFRKTAYSGPCPPSGSHRYFFRVYALDCELNLDFATKKDLEIEMKPHILAKGEIMARYR